MMTGKAEEAIELGHYIAKLRSELKDAERRMQAVLAPSTAPRPKKARNESAALRDWCERAESGREMTTEDIASESRVPLTITRVNMPKVVAAGLAVRLAKGRYRIGAVNGNAVSAQPS